MTLIDEIELTKRIRKNDKLIDGVKNILFDILDEMPEVELPIGLSDDPDDLTDSHSEYCLDTIDAQIKAVREYTDYEVKYQGSGTDIANLSHALCELIMLRDTLVQE